MYYSLYVHSPLFLPFLFADVQNTHSTYISTYTAHVRGSTRFVISVIIVGEGEKTYTNTTKWVWNGLALIAAAQMQVFRFYSLSVSLPSPRFTCTYLLSACTVYTQLTVHITNIDYRKERYTHNSRKVVRARVYCHTCARGEAVNCSPAKALRRSGERSEGK